MHAIKYEIRTKYGDWYKLDERGYVLTYSNGLDKRNASTQELKTWQMLGAYEVRPFGRVGTRLIPLHELCNFKSDADYLFKNGTPKYTLCDIDHGTQRIHGNTQAHGVYVAREIIK